MVRYVGKSNDPNCRFRSHLCQKSHTHKWYWLSKLKSLGLRPIIDIVDSVDVNEWKESERWWISYLRFIGCPLTNISIGGDGSDSVSELTRRKMSESQKKRTFPAKTEEWKNNIRKAKIGTRHSEKSLALMREIHTGRLHTEETKRKISNSHKRSPRINNAIKAAADLKRGSKLPDWWRVKMSESHKLRWANIKSKAA